MAGGKEPKFRLQHGWLAQALLRALKLSPNALKISMRDCHLEHKPPMQRLADIGDTGGPDLVPIPGPA